MASEKETSEAENRHEVTKERDELKAAYEREIFELKKNLDNCEQQFQDKCNELFTANATNSAQADQLRDALNEAEKYKRLYSADHDRMDAAERCIDEIRGFHWDTFDDARNLADNIKSVILSYENAKETK